MYQICVADAYTVLTVTYTYTRQITGITYGLGSAGVSSKALTNGEWTGVLTLYGRRSPRGL